ncbi:hypothetical protein [Streptomyces sp. NPDC059378]
MDEEERRLRRKNQPLSPLLPVRVRTMQRSSSLPMRQPWGGL